ncbi:hypothetical protein JQ617_18495 [Bradyrhizobium sp. KB893862 SZCCT0404]|uniref:hypothetical protein n=1 Tax=Bradyrhizobium sp. KB893862 SZCCT0404 TaxID=2807672 RepID=UPI001BAC2DFD|nr:hypothetical protein [Bradyrhizobium sp. KB893862 SZCCT0404]
MTIYRYLQNMPFGPEEVTVLVTAYARALKAAGLVDRNDPIAEMIAKKVIEIAQRGVKDPAKIADLTIMELRAK